MTERSPSLSTSSSLTPPPIIVSINLDALKHNYDQIRRFIPATTKILSIIKADAYGHGAVSIARALEPLGDFGFGVASVREGLALRENQVQAPIIVMGPLLPEHIPELVQYRLTPVISHRAIWEKLRENLSRTTTPFPIHLKIDTGLHRLGFDPEDALQLLTSSYYGSSPPLEIQGLMTHFADADNPDPSFTNRQIQKFLSFIDNIQSRGIHIPLHHMANSAGILFHPTSHLEMVRPGLMLYGYAPTQPNHPCPLSLKPVMRATTYIAHLRSLQPDEVVGYNSQFRTQRPSQIGVLPVGYTHGFPRHLIGRGHVLIRSQPAPIIGKICMDMMMVDVTDIPHPKIGEEVVLLGQQGNQHITADDFARWLDSIPYEVLCEIGGKTQGMYEPTRHNRGSLAQNLA